MNNILQETDSNENKLIIWLLLLDFGNTKCHQTSNCILHINTCTETVH